MGWAIGLKIKGFCNKTDSAMVNILEYKLFFRNLKRNN